MGRFFSYCKSNRWAIALAASLACFSLFVSFAPPETPWYVHSYPFTIAGAVLCFFAVLWIERCCGLVKGYSIRGKSVAVYLFAAVCSAVCFYEYALVAYSKKLIVFGVLALPALLYGWLRFWDFAVAKGKSLLSRMSLADRIVAACVVVFAFAAVGALQAGTTLFHNPVFEGRPVLFDVVFTADNGHLLYRDAFFSPSCVQNDIRQPFFALTALPFALPAKLFSYLCFFWKGAYAYFLCVMQILVLYGCALLLAKLSGAAGAAKHLVCLLFLLMSAQLLFVLVLEQYVFALFWLLVAVYGIVNGKRRAASSAFAAGALTTSILLAPFTTEAYGKGKTFLQGFFALAKGCFKALGWFLFFLVAFGQIGQLYPANFKEILGGNTGFLGGGVSFLEIFCQYTVFLRNLLFFPLWEEGLTGGAMALVEGAPCMLLPAADSVSYTGLAVFFLTLVLFVMQRKDSFVQLCGYWILVSAVILLGFGWGSAENGMVLYSMYFAWAFFGIWMRALLRVTGRKSAIVVLSVLAVCLALVNIPALAEVISFGVRCYPV